VRDDATAFAYKGLFAATRDSARDNTRDSQRGKHAAAEVLDTIDDMRARRLIALALLSPSTLTVATPSEWSDSSSSSSSSSGSSSRFSEGSADWDSFESATSWNHTVNAA